MQQTTKEDSKALAYLLKKFGFDIAMMVEQRRSVIVTDSLLPVSNGNTNVTQIVEHSPPKTNLI